jgi:uncharacterized protein (TIGR03067 family)
VKKTFFLALTCSLSLPLAPLVHCGEGKEDARILEATWVPAIAELAGKEFPEKVLKTMKLIVKDGRYTAKVGDVIDQGTVKIDSTKKPKAMDIMGTEGPNKGKTFLAIYELKGDSLRICYDLSGKARPTEFKTKVDTQLFLVTYMREKP